jgi:hypothetical protein
MSIVPQEANRCLNISYARPLAEDETFFAILLFNV